MAQFVVPQFIEREPKIVGPFTWKQFIFVAIAGAICFLLYFSLPFHYFLFATIVLTAGALSLAFLKIGGRPIPIVLQNFLIFFLKPKIYVWGRKAQPPKIIKVEKPKPEEKKEGPVLKIAERSQLQNLSTRIQTMPK